MDNFGQIIIILGAVSAIIGGIAGAFASITKGMANLRQMRVQQSIPVSPSTHRTTAHAENIPSSPQYIPQPGYSPPLVRFGATTPYAPPVTMQKKEVPSTILISNWKTFENRSALPPKQCKNVCCHLCPFPHGAPAAGMNMYMNHPFPLTGTLRKMKTPHTDQ